MPAGPKDTIWKAEPHTVAKIDILEAYLVAYFQILGRTRPNQKILCVDGFAGPNKYTNRLFGSPAAALSAAETAITKTGDAWLAGKIYFAFVEQDKARYDVLRQRLPQPTSHIHVYTYNTEFTRALPLIKQVVPEPFHSDCPLFVFIDPFGVTGAPFQNVAEILNSPCSEVLINLDADGVGRNFKANNDAVLTDIFGDTSWKTELCDDLPFDMLCRKVLQIYKNRLRTLPNVRYTFEVEMQGANGTLNYFLVFASKHPLGLMKMKEAMKSIAQNGTYKFADADVWQTALFRFDEPEAYHMKLYEAFKHSQVEYDSRDDDVTAFALNDTPFVDAKSMLTLLEKEGLVTAISSNPKRRRGTFDKTVSAINFHGRAQDGVLF